MDFRNSVSDCCFSHGISHNYESQKLLMYYGAILTFALSEIKFSAMCQFTVVLSPLKRRHEGHGIAVVQSEYIVLRWRDGCAVYDDQTLCVCGGTDLAGHINRRRTVFNLKFSQIAFCSFWKVTREQSGCFECDLHT
jgi:hypothetical protein